MLDVKRKKEALAFSMSSISLNECYCSWDFGSRIVRQNIGFSISLYIFWYSDEIRFVQLSTVATHSMLDKLDWLIVLLFYCSLTKELHQAQDC